MQSGRVCWLAVGVGGVMCETQRALTRTPQCGESIANMWMDLAGFAGIMALGQMVPGPDWILVTRGALAHGMREAAWTATGIACGLMIHAAVAVGGLAMYVSKSEAAWGVVRWLAAGYLLWIAFSILRDGMRDGEADANEVRGGRPFLRGFFCNLLNGKVCLFLVAVCATYLHGERPPYWPLCLWVVIVVQGWVLWIAWASLLQRSSVREIHRRFRHWWDRLFAAGLLVLAVRLVCGL